MPATEAICWFSLRTYVSLCPGPNRGGETKASQEGGIRGAGGSSRSDVKRCATHKWSQAVYINKYKENLMMHWRQHFEKNLIKSAPVFSTSFFLTLILFRSPSIRIGPAFPWTEKEKFWLLSFNLCVFSSFSSPLLPLLCPHYALFRPTEAGRPGCIEPEITCFNASSYLFFMSGALIF